MIVIVAPYSPAGRNANPHLGAARKIESVIGILGERNTKIVLVNTAHDSNTEAPLTLTNTAIAGVRVTELFPPTFTSRRIGKLLNIMDVPGVVRAVLELGSPELVWLYNGYAFESRFGRLISRKMGCPIIQEMEDWHFSRGRGWNPKPLVDWLLWRMAARHVSYAFAVNASLADRMGGLSENVGLFPGVVAPGVANITHLSPPFSSADQSVTVGYFGGLSREKGADLVLALAREMPLNFKLVATGSGELEEAFRQSASQSAGRFAFHGRVDDSKLLELIAGCDVLLNPHSPIESMANGIFPFKVIEGIASGRLMISTPLPSSGLDDVLQGVDFISHDFQQLLHAVVNARATYESSVERIQEGANRAALMFGKDAILSKVNRVCDGVAA